MKLNSVFCWTWTPQKILHGKTVIALHFRRQEFNFSSNGTQSYRFRLLQRHTLHVSGKRAACPKAFQVHWTRRNRQRWRWSLKWYKTTLNSIRLGYNEDASWRGVTVCVFLWSKNLYRMIHLKPRIQSCLKDQWIEIWPCNLLVYPVGGQSESGAESGKQKQELLTRADGLPLHYTRNTLTSVVRLRDMKYACRCSLVRGFRPPIATQCR